MTPYIFILKPRAKIVVEAVHLLGNNQTTRSPRPIHTAATRKDQIQITPVLRCPKHHAYVHLRPIPLNEDQVQMQHVYADLVHMISSPVHPVPIKPAYKDLIHIPQKVHPLPIQHAHTSQVFKPKNVIKKKYI